MDRLAALAVDFMDTVNFSSMSAEDGHGPVLSPVNPHTTLSAPLPGSVIVSGPGAAGLCVCGQ